MIKTFVFILVMSLPVSVCAEENYGHVVASSLVSVYDADTFRVNIDHWPPVVGEKVAIRINGNFYRTLFVWF